MTNDLMKRIKELDVFSLIVFRHIFESGHANEVARSLGVSASKISRSLNALRVAFNNDLFYRRQQGLKPTLLAEKLYPNICVFTDSLDQFKKLLVDEFEYREELVLKLGVLPMFMRVVAERLAQPEIKSKIGKVQIISWNDNSIDNLHKGELDFGIAYELADGFELTQEKIIDTEALCIVANEQHPIWQLNDISLDDLSEHPFVYIASKGFNDRLDPFEQYCRENERVLTNVTAVRSYGEWCCHLLTMDSVALAHISELNVTNSIIGLRAERMQDCEFERLDSALRTPRVLFVERSKMLRRYDEHLRQFLMAQFYDVFRDNMVIN